MTTQARPDETAPQAEQTLDAQARSGARLAAAAARDTLEQAKSLIVRHPLASAGAAAGLGAIVGLFLLRSKR